MHQLELEFEPKDDFYLFILYSLSFEMKGASRELNIWDIVLVGIASSKYYLVQELLLGDFYNFLTRLIFN